MTTFKNWFFVQAFLWCCCFALSSQAQILNPPGELNAAVKETSLKLLTDFWNRDIPNQQKSKSLFAETEFKDPTLMLVFLLNRIHHNKAAEALDIAEELTLQYPKAVDGWVVKIWLQALMDRYDLAPVSIRTLKIEIDSANLNDQQLKQIYRRLGRLIGYFQGPVRSKVNQQLLEDTTQWVIRGIPNEILAIFEKNRNEVLQQHAELLDDQKERTDKELQKVQAQNEQETININNENQQLSNMESQLIPERQRISTESSAEISRLEQEGQSIELQLNQIASDILFSQQNLSQLYIDWNYLQTIPASQRGGIFFLNQQIRNAELNLAGLRSSSFGLSNQLVTISNQIARTRQSAQNQIRELDRQLKKLSATRRRNLNKLNRFAAGPEIADGKRAAMVNREISLRTYDDLSEELYRQDLLRYLR
ncbi:MAG: hypothetical protein AAF939_13370 [Planctomycetota bacterium]